MYTHLVHIQFFLESYTDRKIVGQPGYHFRSSQEVKQIVDQIIEDVEIPIEIKEMDHSLILG